ncbi:hypothetical protein TGVAND_287970 [Toxoplasma gondii VAND]|uniref:Uncharacterized protein n=1 Tax=Toxoplasma gondii VAND TaxID=933077 RepID=A0A086Q7Y9_TOXGO|nr:hypothetical protein TGVAND_287970 [Toxoplasma gondii VAND]
MDYVPEEFVGNSRPLHSFGAGARAERLRQDMAAVASAASAASAQISEPYASGSEEEEVMIDDEEYQLILSPFHACSPAQPPLSLCEETGAENSHCETPKFASTEREEGPSRSSLPSPAPGSTTQEDRQQKDDAANDRETSSPATRFSKPAVSSPASSLSQAVSHPACDDRGEDPSAQLSAAASPQTKTEQVPDLETEAPDSDDEDNTYAVRIVITGPARWRGDLSFQGTPAMLCTILRLRRCEETTQPEKNNREEPEETPCSSKWREEIVLQKRGWGPLVLEEVLVHARRLQQAKQQRGKRGEETEVLLLHFHRSVDEIPRPSEDHPFILPSALTHAPLSVLRLPLSDLDLGPTESKYRLTLPPPSPFAPSPSFLLSPSFSVEKLSRDFGEALQNSTRGANRCNVILFSLKLTTLLTSPSTQKDQLFLLHTQQQQLRVRLTAAACGGPSPPFLASSLSCSGSRSLVLADHLAKLTAAQKALSRRERQVGGRACASVVQGRFGRADERRAVPGSVACMRRGSNPLTTSAPLLQPPFHSTQVASPPSVVSAPAHSPRGLASESPEGPQETAGTHEDESTAPAATLNKVGSSEVRGANEKPETHASEGPSTKTGLVMTCRPVSAPSTRLIRMNGSLKQNSRGVADDAQEVSWRSQSEKDPSKMLASQSEAGVESHLFLAIQGQKSCLPKGITGHSSSSCIYAETTQRSPDFQAEGGASQSGLSLQTMRLKQSFARIKGAHFRPPKTVLNAERDVEDIYPDDSVSVHGGQCRRLYAETSEQEAEERRRAPKAASSETGFLANRERDTSATLSAFRRSTSDLRGREVWSSDGETNSCCDSAGTLLSDAHSRKTTLTSSIQRMNFLMNQAQLLLQRRQLKHQQRVMALQREEERAARNVSCEAVVSGGIATERNEAGRPDALLGGEKASRGLTASQLRTQEAGRAEKLRGLHATKSGAEHDNEKEETRERTPQSPHVSDCKEKFDSRERVETPRPANSVETSCASPSPGDALQKPFFEGPKAVARVLQPNIVGTSGLTCKEKNMEGTDCLDGVLGETANEGKLSEPPTAVPTTTGSAACVEEGLKCEATTVSPVSRSDECEDESEEGILNEARGREQSREEVIACPRVRDPPDADAVCKRKPPTEEVTASQARNEESPLRSSSFSPPPDGDEKACFAPAPSPSLLSLHVMASGDGPLESLPPSFSHVLPSEVPSVSQKSSSVTADLAPQTPVLESIESFSSLQPSEKDQVQTETKAAVPAVTFETKAGPLREEDKQSQLHEEELRTIVDQLRGYMVRIEHRLSKRLANKKKKLGKWGEKASRKGDSGVGVPDAEGPQEKDRRRRSTGRETENERLSLDKGGRAFSSTERDEMRRHKEESQTLEACPQRALAVCDLSYIVASGPDKRKPEQGPRDGHPTAARLGSCPASAQQEAYAQKQKEDQAALERLEAECLSARAAIAALKADLARTVEEKEALRQAGEKKEEERERKEQALKQEKRQLELAFEKEKAVLEERLRRGVEAEQATRHRQTAKETSDKNEPDDEAAEKEQLKLHARKLAAAYGALSKKVQLEATMRDQAMKKKEEEMRAILEHLKKQEARLRQIDEENGRLQAQLRSGRGDSERLRSQDTPPSSIQARETEDLRRQLQDATQELTRQQQKIRLLEDQQRSVAVCASSSSFVSGSSSSPTYPGGVNPCASRGPSASLSSPGLEQVEKLQRELALAEKDRIRLLALDKQREKERLHLVDLFSLQCMRVKELEQQLLQIDEQLANILSQTTRATASASRFSHASCRSGGSEKPTGEYDCVGNAQNGKENETIEGKESSCTPFKRGAPATESPPYSGGSVPSRETDESVSFRPSVLQRLRGMRESIRHMQSRPGTLPSSLNAQSLAGLSKPLGRREERETKSEIGFLGGQSPAVHPREKGQGRSPLASLSHSHPAASGREMVHLTGVPGSPGPPTGDPASEAGTQAGKRERSTSSRRPESAGGASVHFAEPAKGFDHSTQRSSSEQRRLGTSAAQPPLSRPSVSTSQTVFVGRPLPRCRSPATRQLSTSSHAVLSPASARSPEPSVVSYGAGVSTPAGVTFPLLGNPLLPWAQPEGPKNDARLRRLSGVGSEEKEERRGRNRVGGTEPHMRSSSAQSAPSSGLHKTPAMPFDAAFVPSYLMTQKPHTGPVSVAAAPARYATPFGSSLMGARLQGSGLLHASLAMQRDCGGTEERLARSLYPSQTREVSDWRGKVDGERDRDKGPDSRQCRPSPVYRFATPTRLAQRLPAGDERAVSPALRLGTPLRQATVGPWLQDALPR